MSPTIFLSYPLEACNPGYGSHSIPVDISPVKSQARGDSCNTYRMGMDNHLGTHVDGPAHFFAGAREIADYEAECWIFNHPLIVKIDLEPEQIVLIEDLESCLSDSADLLLLRSGWDRHRGGELYSRHNPGISPEVGWWLRRNYPNIRAIGFDFVSLSSFAHRESGREAHRAFLDPGGLNAPLLILEDMDLSQVTGDLASVLVSPLRIRGVDSAPCTVLGVLAASAG